MAEGDCPLLLLVEECRVWVGEGNDAAVRLLLLLVLVRRWNLGAARGEKN